MYNKDHWTGKIASRDENFVRPKHPSNGANGISLLKQNKVARAKNEVQRYAEAFERQVEFDFCYHLNKFNKGWTALFRF